MHGTCLSVGFGGVCGVHVYITYYWKPTIHSFPIDREKKYVFMQFCFV